MTCKPRLGTSSVLFLDPQTPYPEPPLPGPPCSLVLPIKVLSPVCTVPDLEQHLYQYCIFKGLQPSLYPFLTALDPGSAPPPTTFTTITIGGLS